MTRKKIVFLCISSVVLVAFLAAALLGQNAPKENIYRYLSVFTEVFSLVRGNYVEEVPGDQLIEGAFNGVTDAVDEYSYYVPPASMAEFDKRASNAVETTGIVPSRRFGYGYVVAVIDGSPAHTAGVEAGDFIEKIDGKLTQKMQLWEMESALARGGSEVKLTVLRSGMAKRTDVTVKRGPYSAALPSFKPMDGIAYLKVPYFGTGTAVAFGDELKKIRTAGLKKLIVDVRGNGAGSVDEAVGAADALLREGLITSLAGKRVEPRKWTADGTTGFDGDVLVLTDHATAGAGEIFASAIHGNKRGRTVGVSTYGRAIFQKFVNLPSGGGLLITIAHYTTPDAKPISEQGLRPDVLVDLTPLLLAKEGEKNDEDLILKKALTLFGTQPEAAKEAA